MSHWRLLARSLLLLVVYSLLEVLRFGLCCIRSSFKGLYCTGRQLQRAQPRSVRYITFRLQASYSSATSHTGRQPCRVKSLYMKRFWVYLFINACYQGVTKRCCLSWLTNSALVYEPKCGRMVGGGVRGLS
jgi:hypothetical protein